MRSTGKGIVAPPVVNLLKLFSSDKDYDAEWEYANFSSQSMRQGGVRLDIYSRLVLLSRRLDYLLQAPKATLTCVHPFCQVRRRTESSTRPWTGYNAQLRPAAGLVLLRSLKNGAFSVARLGLCGKAERK